MHGRDLCTGTRHVPVSICMCGLVVSIDMPVGVPCVKVEVVEEVVSRAAGLARGVLCVCEGG